MYKKAAQEKLRFRTTVGLVSVEQLWDLPQVRIAEAIRELKKVLKKDDDDDLSFLTSATKTVESEENQLRFEILKDVYLTKKKIAEDARTAASNKEHNEKILQLIAEKQDGELKGKTIDELKAMLKE